MCELLLEIFSEEIPARMQTNALVDLKNIIINHFTKHQIQYSSLETFITPRRLVLHVEGLKYSSTIHGDEEKRGPKVDADDRAISGFLKTYNISKKDLTIKAIKGEDYYFAKIAKTTESLEEILSGIIEKTLYDFPWPKKMRWDYTNVSWVRPIRNILCIFDNKILPVIFGAIKSNDISFGHRFLSPQNFKVKNFQDYKAKLEARHVVLEQSERKKIILDSVEKILKQHRFSLIEDESLLDEIIGLVEYPIVLFGSIDSKFMHLPKEILIASIKTNQKYLTLQDQKNNMVPYFIVVSNNNPAEKSLIIKGNEKVLRARLYDAEFFFKEDQKVTLESRVHNLKEIVFHKKLGTIFDKTERVIMLSDFLAKSLNIKNIKDITRAAFLSKSDLATSMVSEFPDLQGVVGRYYAKNDKENQLVCDAIFEHYLPRGRHDECPKFQEASIISIADKVDSIVGLFSAGEAPTSSKDPYGLRRSVLGILRILMESEFSLNIKNLIKISLDAYKVKKSEQEVLIEKIFQFFYDRFKFFLKNEYNESVIISVFNKSEGDVYLDFKKIGLLSTYLATAEGKAAYLSIKRIQNIIESYDIKNVSGFDKALLVADVEKKLYIASEDFKKDVEKHLKLHNFLDLFKSMSLISGMINSFFDETMVMVDDKKLRDNRIALLQKISLIFSGFVDFSVIEL